MAVKEHHFRTLKAGGKCSTALSLIRSYSMCVSSLCFSTWLWGSADFSCQSFERLQAFCSDRLLSQCNGSL